jgi:8-oxo-dGTP diphosphatase
METKKPVGTSILFVNNKNEILLFLRDDIPNIPFPNCWDILGGHPEGDETPEECIRREMKEEIELDVNNPKLFKVSEMSDRTEYTFWGKANFEIENINLHEGQKLQWFSEDKIKNLSDDEIAFNFKQIILDFFTEKPY